MLLAFDILVFRSPDPPPSVVAVAPSYMTDSTASIILGIYLHEDKLLFSKPKVV